MIIRSFTYKKKLTDDTAISPKVKWPRETHIYYTIGKY